MKKLRGASLIPEDFSSSDEETLEGEPTPKQNTRTGKPKTAKSTKVRDHYIVLSPSDPLTSACRFISEHHTQDDLKTLCFYRGDFYIYTGSHFQKVGSQDIRTQLYSFLKQAKRLTDKGAYVPFEPNQPKVSHVVDALKAESFINSEVGPPIWLNDSDIPPDEILACKNGLLCLSTRKLIPHTPAFFALGSLPYSYKPEVKPSVRWFRFLKKLWGDDPDSIRALQEWFGYCLRKATSQQKILLIIGPIRAGKGVIGRTQRNLLGSANTVAPSLSDLAQPFGLQPLLDKRLAVVSDIRLGRTDQSIIIERLLSISGEDVITVHRKNRTAITGILPIKFLLLSNELPNLQDSSGAAVSRLIVLKLNRSFLGQEDTTLTDRLADELPALLNWSLDGLDRLQKRGHFRQPKSAKKAIEQLEELGSPVGEFIRDKCQLGPSCSVSTDRLFKAWKRWCEAQNVQPGSQSLFGRSLNSYAPCVEKKRPRKDGRKGRYIGIKLA